MGTRGDETEPITCFARLWAVTIVAFGAIVMGQPALAAEGKRVAFVMGIATYDNLSLDKQLTNPVNDAEGVSTKLREIGFLVTEAPNITRSDFNKKWQAILHSLTQEDTFLLFYSGHGVQIDGQNYLLPRDIPPIEYGSSEQLKREAISVSELIIDLTRGRRDRSPPKRAVVILDACRNNPLIPAGNKGFNNIPSGLAKPSSTEGLFVIYSAAEDSVSLDRLPNDNNSVKYSVFTRALLPLLSQPLTLQDLSVNLKKNVLALTKETVRPQLPAYYDGTDGEPFCLPGCTAKTTEGATGIGAGVAGSIGSATGTSSAAAPVHPASIKEIAGMDGAPMVLIHDGEFWMGSSDGEGHANERPRHKVVVRAFYLDKYEITNELFQKFVEAKFHRTAAETEGEALSGPMEDGTWRLMRGASWQKPEGQENVFNSDRIKHPVTVVDWNDADSYCRWFQKRLPTEAEFEYAIRGGTETQYWWGPERPNRAVANILDESGRSIAGRNLSPREYMAGYDDGFARTASVGSFSPNGFGLYDITGNVWEWTGDWYDDQYYRLTLDSASNNPKGPPKGDKRVLRGGSWFSPPDRARSAFRHEARPSHRDNTFGFRCAKDIPK